MVKSMLEEKPTELQITITIRNYNLSYNAISFEILYLLLSFLPNLKFYSGKHLSSVAFYSSTLCLLNMFMTRYITASLLDSIQPW